jgi:hypothetical protein
MTEDLKLPTGETVRFTYLRKWPNLHDMIYLQSVRSGLIKEDSLTAKGYLNMAPHYANQLADALGIGDPPFDAGVMPPSVRNDAEVYFKEVVRRTNIRDLSQGFSRKGTAKSETSQSVEKIIAEFSYSTISVEECSRSLLIIDDSVASGRTICAVLAHLRQAGLPRDCSVMVAAPVWLARN